MIFTETHLNGNFTIDLNKNADDRGFFARYFCKKEFEEHGLCSNWVQVNNSLSTKAGTLRGLHLQKVPFSEVKLVRCIKGSFWDVVVDLRKGSKSFGDWFGTVLSEENRTMMYVPEGFAHGFISLKENSEMLYNVSEYYNPAYELTLAWNDPTIKIDWPLFPKVVSDKDKLGMKLEEINPLESD